MGCRRDLDNHRLTLPANRAIVVHPELEYVLLETDKHRFIIAENLYRRRWRVGERPPRL